MSTTFDAAPEGAGFDVTATEPSAVIRADVVDAEPSLGNVVELLLKNQSTLSLLLRNDTGQRWLMPRFLAIAMFGFAFYGAVATLVLNVGFAKYDYWMPLVPRAFFNSASIGNLTLAYCIGLIAANGICLPSFYFYSLLAGVRVTMLAVSAHALKGMAAGALALIGILPIYVALALIEVVVPAGPQLLQSLTIAGLALPFIAGGWGAVSLYQGFTTLDDALQDRCGRDRVCFLRRLIFFWTTSYLFVTPLVIYTLWVHLADMLH